MDGATCSVIDACHLDHNKLEHIFALPKKLRLLMLITVDKDGEYFNGMRGERGHIDPLHNTEIVGADPRAKFPHQFPSRLFYPRKPLFSVFPPQNVHNPANFPSRYT